VERVWAAALTLILLVLFLNLAARLIARFGSVKK
jgi:phosphate transport system permease protein